MHFDFDPTVLAAVAAALGMVSCGPHAGPPRPAPPFGGVAGPLIVAHRGGALEAPENTLASVRHGVACGADWQEIDVRLTRDEEVVVIHDDTLERTTNGIGPVAAATLAQVRALYAGRPRVTEDGRATLALFDVAPPEFGGRFAAERVPTLAEALAVPEARLMIELKRSPRPDRLVDAVLAAVHRAGAADRVAFGSFDDDVLFAAHQRDPSIPLFGIVEEERELENKLNAHPISVLAVRLDLIEAAKAVAPPKVAVWAWTAYSVEMARAAIERGADAVITDVPAAVVKDLRTPPSPIVELSE